ncbi:hypothetical protein I6F35_06160 [Bradyrhizobium sp. BRP22]|uniref:hypothetical protein n=1 Tax=Bradyrhizobium sp. BRP22 TaxID=2793821 RepID=UPI001CD241D5|nr:hypothetical protein [Bradyrhizobium sp. BRP22]MCA1452803.1 hypothetical protein [Bradyrhizobium sp. BRP22]
MIDEHQMHSIIATAICECRKERPDQQIDIEEAKSIAKCIVEALADAGLQIAPAKPSNHASSTEDS